MYIFNSQFIYVTSHFECRCVICVCAGVLLLRFDDDGRVFTRLLIWQLKMRRMVHRQFPLDLPRCTLNLQVSVMVQLRSFLFRAHDADGFDVLHLMPVSIVVVIVILVIMDGMDDIKRAASICVYVCARMKCESKHTMIRE